MENDVIYSLKSGKFEENDNKIKGYTPSQISSLILSKLKDFSSKINKAVITVPALFSERDKNATLDAAKIAKLDVELINEPTAAVLHYANLPGTSISGRVLIFDLGGGTFDITIAAVRNKKVDVITSVGDKELGGQDFDREIIKLLAKKYKKSKNSNLDEDDKSLLKIAEKIKKLLSSKDKVSEIVDGPKGPLKIDISRNEFENIIDTFLKKLRCLWKKP